MVLLHFHIKANLYLKHIGRISLKYAGENTVGRIDGHTDGPLCPVSAGVSYIKVCGIAEGQFFKFSDGSSMR